MANSTYDNLIDEILDEINEPDKLAIVSPQSIQGYILQGCQQITQRFPVQDETELRLVYGVTKYNFVDSTLPVTGTGTINALNKDVIGVTAVGTGTISTSGEDVTGVGTLFLSELAVGKMIIVGTEKKVVNSITSNTICVIDGEFDTDLSASTFSYSTTMFTKEVNVGSSIISDGVTKIVEAITDAYNLTVTVPYTASQTAKSFTIDTKVTEIPSKFSQITRCNRLDDTIPVTVKVVSNEELVRQKNFDNGVDAYPSLLQPYMIAEWQEGSDRYLEIYPSIETDRQITLYGYIEINPRSYLTELLTSPIPLPFKYEPTIKEYAKYRIYKILKDEKQAMDAFTLFNNCIDTMIANMPVTRRMTVDYT